MDVSKVMLLCACRMQNPTYTVQVAPDFPIQVHEGNDTVTVQAGVTQRILLNYLAAYMCASPVWITMLPWHYVRIVIPATVLAFRKIESYEGGLLGKSSMFERDIKHLPTCTAMGCSAMYSDTARQGLSAAYSADPRITCSQRVEGTQLQHGFS